MFKELWGKDENISCPRLGVILNRMKRRYEAITGEEM